MSDDNKKSTTANDQTNPIIFTEDTVPPFYHGNPTPPAATGIPEAHKEDLINPSPTDTINTASGSAAPTPDIITDTVMPAVVTTGAPKKKFAGGKVIATILGLVVLVGGLGAGIYLTGQNQNIAEKASWEQDQRCKELKACGRGCRQEYNSDCTGDDEPPPPPPPPPPTETPITAECKNIKAYARDTWELIGPAKLSTLKNGESVNFCVSGTRTGGNFDKAKFTINGVAQAETTTRRPGKDSFDFCQLYTISTATTGSPATTGTPNITFNITAQIHHSTLGWK